MMIALTTIIRFAEMSKEVKNSISHRKRALAKLKEFLENNPHLLTTPSSSHADDDHHQSPNGASSSSSDADALAKKPKTSSSS